MAEKISKELEARIKDLDARLDNAVVELVDKDAGVYTVFVPGAIRERNTVKAKSRNEAVQKVKEVLIIKLTDREQKQIARDAQSDGELEVESSTHKNKAKDVEV